jgi:putative oxygen-independent coproporphyrinogen III oxidase
LQTSLYVHLPWCLKKCPYCDFNSYPITDKIPEDNYIAALSADLTFDLPLIQNRSISSIYIGGGTPTLFSANALKKLLDVISKKVSLANNLEITLEANPGSIDLTQLKTLRTIGINRISLGIQSFNDRILKKLGRLHDKETALTAIDTVKKAGFTNFNLDLIYGSPGQTVRDAIADLKMAISKEPTHLSWYQLNIEPGTIFYKNPPTLPNEDLICEIERVGHELLSKNGFNRYEISAYSKKDYECQHNINYWLFGDYLGIGAGAHTKITDLTKKTITRFSKIENPKLYLRATDSYIANKRELNPEELPLEFMLNALRLYQTLPINLFCERTYLKPNAINDTLESAQKLGLINYDDNYFTVTKRGHNFLNDLLLMFT